MLNDTPAFRSSGYQFRISETSMTKTWLDRTNHKKPEQFSPRARTKNLYKFIDPKTETVYKQNPLSHVAVRKNLKCLSDLKSNIN